MIDSPSDVFLILCLLGSFDFSASFALGRPRVWFRDRLGWVIFLNSLAIGALLFLIVWGIVFGQGIDEPYRLTISAILFGTMIAMRWILHVERKAGRLPNQRPQRKAKT